MDWSRRKVLAAGGKTALTAAAWAQAGGLSPLAFAAEEKFLRSNEAGASFGKVTVLRGEAFADSTVRSTICASSPRSNPSHCRSTAHHRYQCRGR